MKKSQTNDGSTAEEHRGMLAWLIDRSKGGREESMLEVRGDAQNFILWHPFGTAPCRFTQESGDLAQLRLSLRTSCSDCVLIGGHKR